MERRKLRVAILFGGRSAEHDVSRASAANVLRSLDRSATSRFWSGSRAMDAGSRPMPAMAPATGAAELTVPEDRPAARAGPRRTAARPVANPVSARRSTRCSRCCMAPMARTARCRARLSWPMCPMSGRGVVGSAAAMDKDVAKRLLRDAGLPSARFITRRQPRRPIGYEEAVARSARRSSSSSRPIWARRSGSRGRARPRSSRPRCAQAFRYDRKILIEERCSGVREIECSVLEDARGPVAGLGTGRDRAGGQARLLLLRGEIYRCGRGALMIPARLTPGAGPRRFRRWRSRPSRRCAARAWRGSTSF